MSYLTDFVDASLEGASFSTASAIAENKAKIVELVESAAVIASQLRAPMCYIMDKPRALVEYAVGSPTHVEQEARVGASIQEFYQQCRAKGSPCFCGD